MKKVNHTNHRTSKRLRTVARIWSSPIIIYVLLLLIGYAWNWITIGKADPYAVEGYPFTEALPPILMFLSVLGLGIAWRWEWVGGAITLVFQFAALLLILIQRPITIDFNPAAIPYFVSIAIVIPGILFLLYGWRSRRVPTYQNES